MTNKEATILINNQINNLHGLTSGNLSLFMNNSKMIIYLIFEGDSNERRFINDLNIDNIYSLTSTQKDYLIQSMSLRFAAFFNNCIETVNKRKEAKSIKENILSHKSDLGLIVTITPIVIPLIVASFFIGRYFGEQKIEKDSILLKIANEKLRDTNSSLIESVKKLTENKISDHLNH